MSGERSGAADLTLRGVATTGSYTARTTTGVRRSSPLSSTVVKDLRHSSASPLPNFFLHSRIDGNAREVLERTFSKTGKVADIFLGVNKGMRDRPDPSSLYRRRVHEDVAYLKASRAAKESQREQ
eukprot:752661-Hanusia_phi.AAC.8